MICLTVRLKTSRANQSGAPRCVDLVLETCPPLSPHAMILRFSSESVRSLYSQFLCVAMRRSANVDVLVSVRHFLAQISLLHLTCAHVQGLDSLYDDKEDDAPAASAGLFHPLAGLQSAEVATCAAFSSTWAHACTGCSSDSIFD